MLKNKKVIVKGPGGDEPYFVGRLVGTKHFCTEEVCDNFPEVLSYKDRQKYIIFGAIVAYNEELTEILDEMTPDEQWDYIRPFNLFHLISEEENG